MAQDLCRRWNNITVFYTHAFGHNHLIFGATKIVTEKTRDGKLYIMAKKSVKKIRV